MDKIILCSDPFIQRIKGAIEDVYYEYPADFQWNTYILIKKEGEHGTS